ncbi:unnamed protein product [Fusarium equiseti]|uniref:DUF7908 domain-containing protein n=1 Tax=Fusarium equiseti TaxID=61235 RepID=A0A8J2NDY2_FUSEQ|nr:unnamed protein product [Fusarium equiseti]
MLDTESSTSVAFPESSRAAELSSDGPEPTVAESGSVTRSLDLITEPVIDEVVTSSLSTELGSTVSTDAIPTSSGFIEPAGRSVIFQVSVVDNQKRSTNKRQAIGGFVGNDNPQSCTFAATFNLAEGQLFEGGTPIYYSGESYKELSGLDFPSSGSITKTFEDTGRLVFRNSALPNGRAGFCQTLDGIVYVTFTNGPVGCISVELVVYDVTQCQDGRLIVDDGETATPSETIPQDTTPLGETDPTVTSGIQDATTVQVSYSSSDFITQSELIGTSHTSDVGASDIISSETTLAETTHAGTTITDTVITDTTIIDTATVDTTMTDTTTDTIIMDTTPLIASTIGVDITTGDTSDITTAAASTTTTEASTTSSGAPDTDCIKANNPYTASNGVTFTLSCNTLISIILLKDPYLSDFIPCLQACSEDESCAGASFSRSFFGSYCYLSSYFYAETAEDDDRFDVAFKDAVIGDTTTAATDAETTDTTTSAAPTETSDLSTCEDLSSPLQVGDDTYDIFCNGYRFFAASIYIETASFLECIQACSQNNNCLGVDYTESSSACLLALVFDVESFFMEDGIHLAIRQRA